jgi:competence protein ComEC
MTSNRLIKYISNHPFIFLISLVLVASCCLGGFLAVAQVGKRPVEATVPAAATTTETITSSLTTVSGSTPSVEVVIPTATSSVEVVSPPVTNTPTLEFTPSRQPATPSQTVEATVPQPTNPLVIHFINVGQGDSILIMSPDGLMALIDGGSANTGVVAYLRGQGVKRIDLMIVTHPHEDHIGGLTQVLETLPVARVVTNGQPHTTAAYEHFLDAILSSGAQYSEVRRGDTIELGELKFSVLSPGATLWDDLNTSSLVLRLVYGQTTFLFMGDAGKVAEGSMIAAGLPLKANILKVGHHGSCSATGTTFLQAVQPEVGIYSAGLNNQYGFPCAATVDALHQDGVLVLGTDVYGSIIVTVGQDGYRITDSAGKEIGK